MTLGKIFFLSMIEKINPKRGKKIGRCPNEKRKAVIRARRENNKCEENG